MAIWKRPDLPAGPLRELNNALHELRERSGLSSRQIAAEIRRRFGNAPSHTTVYQLFTHDGVPAADLVLRVAEILLAASPGRRTVSDDETLDRIDTLWQRAAEQDRQRSDAVVRQDGAAPRQPRQPRPAPQPMWEMMTLSPNTPRGLFCDVTAVDPTHAWAVGGPTYWAGSAPEDTTPFIQQWDGALWSPVPLPTVTWRGTLHRVAADSPANVVAVGHSTGPEQADRITRVVHFDGSEWRELPPPLDNPANLAQQITGLAVVGGHAWLVGQGHGGPVVLEWDGRSWREHQPPLEGRYGYTFFDKKPIYCLLAGITAFAPNNIWACGRASWTDFTGPALFNWDGRSWETVRIQTSHPETMLFAVTGHSPDDLWAAGHAYGRPEPEPVIVHGDSVSWQVFDKLPDAQLNDVAQDCTGRPWVIENPSNGWHSAFASYDLTTNSWVHSLAPQLRGTRLRLHAITAVPGSTLMFAVGESCDYSEPYTCRPTVLCYGAPTTPGGDTTPGIQVHH